MELQGFSSVAKSSLHTERESNGSPSLSPCSSPELGGQGGHPVSVKGDERERELIGTPQPLECLHESPIPPFLSKTYDLVEDRSLDPIISWASSGESFVVWDHVEFERVVLPRNFKHSNFSSFVRQLNTYGFRKIHTDRWEFANEEFVWGKKYLLKNIHRRKSTQLQQISSYSESSIEARKAGLESEVGMLKNENNLMVQEVLRLRQEHEGTAQKIEAMKQRIQTAEHKQKQMVSFFAKLLQNPVFLARLQQNAELKESGSQRVRRKLIKQQQSDQAQVDSSTGGQVLKYGPHRSSTPKYLATRDLEPVVEKQLPVSTLEGIVGNLGVGVSDTQVQSSNIASGEMYQESAQSSERMGVATLDLGPMGSEDAFIKEKNVMSPRLEVDTEYHVLAREKTYPSYMFPQTESMLKPMDIWSMGFDASSDASTSSQDVLDNLGSSYVWDMGFSGIGNLPDDESAVDDF